MYCGAVRNICTVRHDCMVADGNIAADAGKAAHSRTGADHTVGVDKGVVSYRCITVDLCSGVQQNAVTNRCTVLDTGVLQHHTTTSQLGVWTDIGTGSNDVWERITK